MEYIKEMSESLGISETEYLQEILDSHREIESDIEKKLQSTEVLIDYYEHIKIRNSNKKKSAKKLDKISENTEFYENVCNEYFYLDLH